MSEASHITLREMPDQPCLIVLNRANLSLLQQLEQHYLPHTPLCWLAEQGAMPADEIKSYLKSRNAPGIIFPTDKLQMDQMRDRLLGLIRQGVMLVFLPGEQSVSASSELDMCSECALDTDTLADATPHWLQVVSELHMDIVPFYLERMPEELDGQSVLSQGSSVDAPQIGLAMPRLPSGAAMVQRLRLSWLEASAMLLAQREDLERADMGEMIIHALMSYAGSSLIDGVDDSIISYDELLNQLLPLTRQLGKTHTLSRRLGILLPPGRDAIMANLACLLTGIVPVNIDTRLSREQVASIIEEADLMRFITEWRYYQKLSHFPWPLKRDLIMMGDLQDQVGRFSKLMLGRVTRVVSKSWLRSQLRCYVSCGEDEAMLFYTCEEKERPCAHSVSHQMMLTSMRMLQQRFSLGQGKTILSSQPYSEPISFMMGMLLPILSGCDLVTYPVATAMGRLRTLIHQYSVNLAMSSTKQLRLAQHEESAPDEQKESSPCLICYGDRLPRDLQAYYETKWGVRFMHSYVQAGSLSFVSVEDGVKAHHSNSRALPEHIGQNGRPLTGMGVRICDPKSEEPVAQSPHQLGMLWLKSGAFLESNEWVRTGDIALVDEAGALCIAGKEQRFSKLEGQLIAHEALEDVLYDILQVKDRSKRQLAIIAVRLKSYAEEKLVLLSCVHETIPTHELMDLRYKLLNRHYPSCWCPEHILPVRSIPVLRDGELDYKRAYAYISRVLGAEAHR